MSDDYVISARIVARDASDAGATSAERRLDRVERRGLSVGRTLQGVFAGLAGAAGVGRLAQGIVGLHSTMQEAEAGMATLLAANQGVGINQALGTARGLVQGLTADAASGAGELGNYMQGLQSMLGPGLGLGATIEQLRELNRNALGAGFALRGQEGLSLAPMDVAQALSGQVGERTTPIVNQALRASGQTLESFRALAPERRVEALNRAFQSFAPGVELMGRSWSAQMSTLFDQSRSLARLVTRPLFDRWSEQLEAANGFLRDNRDGLEAIATRWGPRLVSMWDTLIERAGTYAQITAAAGAVHLLGGASGVGAIGQRLAGGATRVVSTAGAAAGAGGGIAGLFTAARAGLTPLVQAAGRLAGPLALVTLLVTGVTGAFQEYTGVAQFVMDQGAGLWESLVQLGESFASLSGEGSALNIVGAGLLGTVGALAWGLARIVDVASLAVLAVGALVRAVGHMVRFIGRAAGALFSDETVANVLAEEGQGLRNAFADMVDGMGRVTGLGPSEDFGFGGMGPLVGSDETSPFGNGPLQHPDGMPGITSPLPKEEGSKAPQNHFHGPMTVTIKAETMEDPARVATVLETVVSQLVTSRRAARRPLPTV